MTICGPSRRGRRFPVTGRSPTLYGGGSPAGISTSMTVVFPARPTSIFVLRSATGHLRAAVRGRLAGGEDTRVRPAPAEVAGHGFLHVVLRGPWVLREEAGARDDHPRRAETALERVGLDERLLDRSHRLGRAEPLDRRDLPAVRVVDEREAGVHGEAVEQDRAGAAGAAGAAPFRV